jgi:endonuclease III related protein
VPFLDPLCLLDLLLFRRYRAFTVATTRIMSQNARPLTLQNIALSWPVCSDFPFAEPQTLAVETSTLGFVPSPVLRPALRPMLSPTPHAYYDALLAAHGPQHWWPGRTRFEIIVGAILTQNTSWTNVERAIRNLRTAHLLSPQAIRRVRSTRLAQLLRPSGYFRHKTKTLKSFVNFLYASYAGSLSRLFATSTAVLRDQLLALRGIGPETADSILLYAGKHPVFVVDAYTRRILQRHGHGHSKVAYDEIRKMFQSALPADQQLFNEFHALIVHVGKNYCRPNNPRCSECSLSRFLPQSILPVT